MNEMHNAEPKVVNAYLNQAFVYHSESKGRFVQVSDMHPNYAGNAAERMIQEAADWLAIAGRFEIKWPALWLVRTPLFQALMAQADRAKDK